MGLFPTVGVRGVEPNAQFTTDTPGRLRATSKRQRGITVFRANGPVPVHPPSDSMPIEQLIQLQNPRPRLLPDRLAQRRRPLELLDSEDG